MSRIIACRKHFEDQLYYKIGPKGQLYRKNEDDLDVMNRLLSKLDNPYGEQEGIEDYQSPSSDESYQTYCGT